jgi:hypothetical protein
VPATGCPRVQNFIVGLLDRHFTDVRAMLQLPRPDIGIRASCNFGVASTLCNLLSGISTTIYKPADLLHEAQSNCGAGRAFQGLIRDFFPYQPHGAVDFPRELYEYARNPLVHALGLANAAPPVVSLLLGRVLHVPHPDSGWTDHELNDLESGRYNMTVPGVEINSQGWALYADSFYFDVIELLRRLTADAAQMQAAETRFQQGVYNWRRQ